MKIDAVGRSCPEPVLMLQKALKEKPESLRITVDNAAARENCSRFAGHAGYSLSVEEEGGVWTLTLTK